jgi:hypothetical protein
MSAVLLYNEGLSNLLIYGRLLARHPELFSAVIEVPSLPVSGTARRTRIVDKLRQASWLYLLFNVVVISFWNVVATIRGLTIRALAKRIGIPFHSFQSQAEIAAWLANRRPVWILNGSGIIMNQALLQIPTAGILNFHCAPLPEYRGAANYIWIVADGLPETHATLHYVDTGLDTGDVILRTPPVAITPGKSVFSLWRDLRLHAADCLESVAPALKSGERLPATPQDHSRGTARSFPGRKDVRRALDRGHDMFRAGDIIWLLKAILAGGRFFGISRP